MQAAQEREAAWTAERAGTAGRAAEAVSPAMPSLNVVEPEERLRQIPQFEETAYKVARGLRRFILRSPVLRRAADVLHGTWLGHPLHVVLTDVVVGAWVFGSVFDFLSLATRSHQAARTADRLVAMGSLAAVPTALAGLTDYSTITRSATATAATHGLINTAALALYTASVANRRSGRRGLAMTLSGVGLGLITVSAWLGGELVYHYRVSVNKAKDPSGPREWQAVLDDAELPEHAPRRLEVNGAPVLLYRHEGQVYAIGAVCAHEGGPLDEGSFDAECVTCPWHQSVFDLRNGRVVHGPSTYPVPFYHTRVRNGRVEVRLSDKS